MAECVHAVRQDTFSATRLASAAFKVGAKFLHLVHQFLRGWILALLYQIPPLVYLFVFILGLLHIQRLLLQYLHLVPGELLQLHGMCFEALLAGLQLTTLLRDVVKHQPAVLYFGVQLRDKRLLFRLQKREYKNCKKEANKLTTLASIDAIFSSKSEMDFSCS